MRWTGILLFQSDSESKFFFLLNYILLYKIIKLAESIICLATGLITRIGRMRYPDSLSLTELGNAVVWRQVRGGSSCTWRSPSTKHLFPSSADLTLFTFSKQGPGQFIISAWTWGCGLHQDRGWEEEAVLTHQYRQISQGHLCRTALTCRTAWLPQLRGCAEVESGHGWRVEWSAGLQRKWKRNNETSEITNLRVCFVNAIT